MDGLLLGCYPNDAPAQHPQLQSYNFQQNPKEQWQHWIAGSLLNPSGKFIGPS